MAQLRDMCFRLTDLGKIETGLNSDSMKLLQAFDGKTPFHKIQQSVGLPADVFKNSFLELFRNKLIEEVQGGSSGESGNEEYLDGSVLEQLSEVAVKIVGPVGGLLVSDALEALKLNPAKVPASRVSELIKTIADDIPGESQAQQFLDSLPPGLLST